MANLPTAYASQKFGRKTLDFYAASGEVSGSDPRARSDERSLTDYDGAKHTVRVMERDFKLEAGDQASVLRMQTGPSQRSRPVALVNHTQKGWSRTHPGASALLSRAGVARNVNWFLTVLLFALASIVMVWPALRVFLAEVDPGVFGALPQFDVFALALAALPDLGAWSFADSVAPLSALIGQAGPFAAERASAIVFYALSGLGALVVFATRSWRLLWAPLFVGLVGAAALGLGGAEAAAGYAVGAYGLSALIFLFGGVINRVRDSARLERRIALLADHLERHPPEETIARAEAPEEDVVAAADVETDADAYVEEDVAPVAIAVPVSAALSGSSDGPEAEPMQSVADAVAPDEEGASDMDAAAVAEAVVETEAEAEVVEAIVEPIAVEDAARAEAVSDEAIESEQTPEPALSDAEAGDEVVIADAAAVESDAEHEAEGEAFEAAQEVEETQTEAVVVAEAEEAPVAASEEALSDEAETLEPALSAEAPEVSEPEDAPLGMAGLDAQEAERLQNDPRYAARAIVLPSPPPMPSAEAPSEAASAPVSGPVTRETRELRPSAPLTNRVLSLFSNPPVPPAPPAPPAPARRAEDEEV